MRHRKRNATSKGKKSNFKEEERNNVEEIVLTKHCHVLLKKLSESELLLLQNKTTNRRCWRKEKELEHHLPSTSKGGQGRVSASSSQSASKIEAAAKQNKTDSKARISRVARRSRPDNGGRQHFATSNRTQSHASEIENGSNMEPPRRRRRVHARGGRSNNREHERNRGFLMHFPADESSPEGDEGEEAPQRHDFEKLKIRFGFDFYVTEFRKYLYALRGNERSSILYELLQRGLKEELTVVNEYLEYVVNRGLVQWIVESALNLEDISLEDQWSTIVRAVAEAETIVLIEKRKSKDNRMLKRRMPEDDGNSHSFQPKVLKLSNTALIENEVEAVKSMKEDASTSMKELSNEKEHFQISSEDKDKNFTKAAILEDEISSTETMDPDKIEVLTSERELAICSNLQSSITTKLSEEKHSSTFSLLDDVDTTNLLVGEATDSTKKNVKNLEKNDQKSSKNCSFNIDSESSEQQDDDVRDTYVVVDEASESNASETSVDNFEEDGETEEFSSECSDYIDLKDNKQLEISCSEQRYDTTSLPGEVETPESNETQIFVEKLQKYDKTLKPSSEYDIDLKNSELQVSLCEGERVGNTFSPTEIVPIAERSIENGDKVQEVTFKEHCEGKQKTVFASDLEGETSSNTENFISNNRSDKLHIENKMPATSDEMCTSEFKETVEAKSTGDRNTIKLLLEECIQHIENQDVIPFREQGEVSVTKIKTIYNATLSSSLFDMGSNHCNAEGRCSSPTKATTSGWNYLPVPADNIKLLNNTPENVASMTEAKTCYEAHLSSGMGSVDATPGENGDSSTTETTSHMNSPSRDRSTELINDTPENLVCVTATKTCCDIEPPNLTSKLEFVHDTAEEKNNSSPAAVSTPEERPNNEFRMEGESEVSHEYCDGQGCKKCEMAFYLPDNKKILYYRPLANPKTKLPDNVLFLKSDFCYVSKLEKAEEYKNSYLSECNAYFEEKIAEDRIRRNLPKVYETKTFEEKRDIQMKKIRSWRGFRIN